MAQSARIHFAEIPFNAVELGKVFSWLPSRVFFVAFLCSLPSSERTSHLSSLYLMKPHWLTASRYQLLRLSNSIQFHTLRGAPIFAFCSLSLHTFFCFSFPFPFTFSLLLGQPSTHSRSTIYALSAAHKSIKVDNICSLTPPPTPCDSAQVCLAKQQKPQQQPQQSQQ